MLYYDAALRRERRQRAGLFMDTRAAFGADKSGAKQHLQSMVED